MSMSYSAGVFFGAAFYADSTVGKLLAAYVDRYGGTPAPTEVEGVEVSTTGWHGGGQVWVVVQAKGSVHEFSRNDDVDAPALLVEDPTWRPLIGEFLRSVGATRWVEGWHFAGSCT